MLCMQVRGCNVQSCVLRRTSASGTSQPTQDGRERKLVQELQATRQKGENDRRAH